MRYAIDPGTAHWNGEWNHLQVPLHQFVEQGSWDGDRWHDPIGAFDWTAVDRFEIAADYHDLRAIHFYFDNIRVITPGP